MHSIHSDFMVLVLSSISNVNYIVILFVGLNLFYGGNVFHSSQEPRLSLAFIAHLVGVNQSSWICV